MKGDKEALNTGPIVLLLQLLCCAASPTIKFDLKERREKT